MTRRYMTRDRTATIDYYTTESLGPKQALTPEGFLLCKDVAIARTGSMIYGPGETPIKVGGDGVAHIERGPDELLKPETIASFNGKPVVDDHPDDDVTPATWRKLAIGVTLNPRAGTNDGEPDVHTIVADLLITDPKAIQAVKDGKREVSCGYDADYEETGPGQGKQTDIIGNHVALVEKGRCGPRCAIGDHHHSAKEQKHMATKTAGGRRRAALSERIRKAFRDAEAAALEEFTDPTGADEDQPGMDDDTTGSGGDGHTHIHIHAGAAPAAGEAPAKDELPAGGDPAAGGGEADPTEARFAALEQGHEEIKATLAAILQKMGGQQAAPTGDELPEDDMDGEVDEEAARTNDSAALATGYAKTLELAEILVPGFRMPTFDAKASRKKTVDMMCAARRKALDAVYATAAGKELVDSVAGVNTLDLAAMDCVGVASLFKSAAGAKRLLNNRGATGDAHKPNLPAAPKTKTVADLAKAFEDHYKV